MRVCFLHNNYYRSSGSAIVIRRIFEAFRGSGIEFYFAGCGAAAEGGVSATEDLLWVPPGRYRRFGLMDVGPALPRELRRFGAWVREVRCDVVHVHHRRLAALANYVCRWHKIPVLFTAHNTFDWEAWFWATAPRHVSGVSPSVVQYLKRATRAQQRLLTWNPFPFPLSSELDTRSLPAQRAVSVGRLEPVKGHLQLIDAWARLRSKGLKPGLDIFGEGYLRPQLEARIASEGLQSQIRLHGFSSDLGRAFDSSLFNILVSQTEGFPNVVVEAAAHRRATLVTDVDGSRDTVPPDLRLPNGIPFGDVQRLTDALAVWFGQPQQALSDGLAFHDFLRERCSPEAVRLQYQEIYEQMCGGAVV